MDDLIEKISIISMVDEEQINKNILFFKSNQIISSDEVNFIFENMPYLVRIIIDNKNISMHSFRDSFNNSNKNISFFTDLIYQLENKINEDFEKINKPLRYILKKL